MNNLPKLQSLYIAGSCGHIEEYCMGRTGEIVLDVASVLRECQCRNCRHQLSDPLPTTLVRKNWEENLDV